MRLTRAQAAARATLEGLLSRPPLDPTALGGVLAATLGEAVGWDGYRMFALDPRSGLFSRLLAASAQDDRSRAVWLQQTYLDAASGIVASVEGTPVAPRRAPAARRSRVVALQPDLAECHGLDLPDWDEAERARFRTIFLEGSERYLLPGRLVGSVTMLPEVGGRRVLHLVAWRLAPARPYSAGDVAFLNLVCGTVGDLVDASMRAERHRPAAEPAPDGSGVVLLAGDGTLRYASPTGDGWLSRLRAADPGAATALPAQVWSTMAWMRTGADRGVLRTTVPGAELTIEATSGGSDGSLALVIAPSAAPAEVGLPPDWRLSPAEARVATLVGRGLSNREVAERLSVSENTVGWHLGHIYASTGIPNRTQLAARLLRGAAS